MHPTRSTPRAPPPPLPSLPRSRWRWTGGAGEDGGEARGRESNARIVRWSDGTAQLLLGGEALDIKEIDISRDSQYVFARHPNIIQGQAQLRTKLVFQPAGLASGLHRQLAAAVDKQHARQSKASAGGTQRAGAGLAGGSPAGPRSLRALAAPGPSSRSLTTASGSAPRCRLPSRSDPQC